MSQVEAQKQIDVVNLSDSRFIRCEWVSRVKALVYPPGESQRQLQLPELALPNQHIVIHGLNARTAGPALADATVTILVAGRDYGTVPVWALCQGRYDLPQPCFFKQGCAVFELSRPTAPDERLDLLVTYSEPRAL